MASTYRAIAQAVTWTTTAKSLLKVFNDTGSGKIVRVYRIWLLNVHTTAVTGVFPPVRIVRISAASDGSSVTPVKHDTNSAALPAQITAAYNDTTVTVDATFRNMIWATDELSVGGTSQDEWETIVPMCCLWDAGYTDSTVEPITLRETYGVSVYTPGIASATGSSDVIIEFTVSDS